MSATQRNQLRRSFELGGATHELDLLPDLAPDVVTVVVDGQVLAKVRKPSPEYPWVEQPLEVAGETVTLAMTTGDVMGSDLFVGDLSLVDGRALTDARAAAPVPVRGYNRWLSDFAVWKRRPSRQDLAGLVVVLVVSASVLTALLSARGSPLDRAVGASLVAAFILALWLAAVIAWMSAVAWVNVRLLRRPALNYALRLLILAARSSPFRQRRSSRL